MLPNFLTWLSHKTDKRCVQKPPYTHLDTLNTRFTSRIYIGLIILLAVLQLYSTYISYAPQPTQVYSNPEIAAYFKRIGYTPPAITSTVIKPMTFTSCVKQVVTYLVLIYTAINIVTAILIRIAKTNGPTNDHFIFYYVFQILDSLFYKLTSLHMFYPIANTNGFKSTQFTYSNDGIRDRNGCILKSFCSRCYIYGHSEQAHTTQKIIIDHRQIHHAEVCGVFMSYDRNNSIFLSEGDITKSNVTYSYSSVEDFDKKPSNYISNHNLALTGQSYHGILPTFVAFINHPYDYSNFGRFSIGGEFIGYITANAVIPHALLVNILNTSANDITSIFNKLNIILGKTSVTIYNFDNEYLNLDSIITCYATDFLTAPEISDSLVLKSNRHAIYRKVKSLSDKDKKNNLVFLEPVIKATSTDNESTTSDSSILETDNTSTIQTESATAVVLTQEFRCRAPVSSLDRDLRYPAAVATEPTVTCSAAQEAPQFRCRVAVVDSADSQPNKTSHIDQSVQTDVNITSIQRLPTALKHFVPDWLLTENVATNTEPLIIQHQTTCTDNIPPRTTKDTATDSDDTGFIYRPKLYTLRTTLSASSALNETPVWIVNAYCDHVLSLNLTILMKFIAAVAFIYLPIHIILYYLLMILTSIPSFRSYLIGKITATCYLLTTVLQRIKTIKFIRVFNIFKSRRNRLCIFTIFSLTVLLIIDNHNANGFSIPSRDNTDTCRLPIITHTNYTNTRLMYDAQAESCFYTDRKSAAYDAQPLLNLMAIYNKFDKGVNLGNLVSPYTSLDDFINTHNLHDIISNTGQLNIFASDNDALMTALSAFAIHVTRPSDAIYPNQIYFSDVIRFQAFNKESNYFISITNDGFHIQLKQPPSSFPITFGRHVFEIKHLSSSATYINILASCVISEPCQLIEEEVPLLRFSSQFITANEKLKVYRHNFINLSTKERNTGEYTLSNFVYTATYDEPCYNSHILDGHCLFDTKVFDIIQCKNSYGLRFECLYGDHLCQVYAEDFCTSDFNQEIKNIVKPVVTRITNITEHISAPVVTVINSTVNRVSNTFERVYNQLPPHVRRGLNEVGVAAMDCNDLNHPDTEPIYNHCINNDTSHIYLFFHVQITDGLYYITNVNSNLTDPNFLSLCSNSIGYSIDDKPDSIRILYRYLFYTPHTYTSFIPLADPNPAVGYWCRSKTYEAFTQDGDCVRVVTGIFYIDSVINDFGYGYITYVLLCLVFMWLFLESDARTVSSNWVFIRLITILLFFIMQHNTPFGFIVNQLLSITLQLNSHYVIYIYIVLLVIGVHNMYLHYLHRRFIVNFYIIFLFELVQNIAIFAFIITTNPAVLPFVFFLVVCVCIYQLYYSDPEPWNSYITTDQARYYTNGYAKSVNAVDLDDARRKLEQQLLTNGQQLSQDEFNRLSMIHQCFDHLDRSESHFRPKLSRYNFIHKLVGESSIAIGVSRYNNLVASEARINGNLSIPATAFERFSVKQNIPVTYHNGTNTMTLYGICCTENVNGVSTNYLILVRHLFGNNLESIKHYKPDQLIVKTEPTMVLDHTSATFNDGFVKIPYTGYQRFQPFVYHDDPINYNGPIVGFVAGGFQTGFADNGRHNLNTKPGDCGGIICTLKGNLLGAHVAAQYVTFRDQIWKQVIGSTILNHFADIRTGAVNSEITGFDVKKLNPSPKRPLLSSERAVEVLNFLTSKYAKQQTPYDPRLDEFFGISALAYRQHNGNINLDYFLQHLDRLSKQLYGGFSLYTLFQEGLNILSSDIVQSETYVTRALMPFHSTGFIRRLGSITDFIWSTYDLFISSLLGVNNVIRTIKTTTTGIKSVDSYIYSDAAHFSYLNFWLLFRTLIFCVAFTRKSTFMERCAALFKFCLRLSLLYLIVPQFCYKFEDTRNLWRFRSSLRNHDQQLQCWSAHGYPINEPFNLLASQFNERNWTSSAGLVFHLNDNHTCFDVYSNYYFGTYLKYLYQPYSIAKCVALKYHYQLNYDYICSTSDTVCTASRYSLLYKDSSGFLSAILYLLYLLYSISPLIIFFYVIWDYLRRYGVEFTYYADFISSSADKFFSKYMHPRTRTIVSSLIVESEVTSIYKTHYDYLRKNAQRLSNLFKVLIGYPVYHNLKPTADLLESLCERFNGGYDNIDETELTTYLDAVQVIKQRFVEYIRICAPIQNRQPLLVSAISRCLELDTGELNETTLKSLVEQLVELFDLDDTTTNPVIVEGINYYDALIQMFPDLINSEHVSTDAYADILSELINDLRTNDEKYRTNIYEYYGMYMAGINDYLAELDKEKATYDTKNDKAIYNKIISRFAELSKLIKKSFKRLESEIDQQVIKQRKAHDAQKNIEVQRQREEIVRLRKAENVARALASIMASVNTIDVNVVSRIRAMIKLITDADPTYTSPLPDITPESTTYFFEGDVYAYLPLLCGKIIRCDKEHKHSYTACYNQLQQQFLEHMSGSCANCFSRYINKSHPNCDSTCDRVLSTFNAYITTYYSCSKCVLCGDCAATNFYRTSSCKSNLAHMNPINIAVKPETFIAPLNISDKSKYVFKEVDDAVELYYGDILCAKRTNNTITRLSGFQLFTPGVIDNYHYFINRSFLVRTDVVADFVFRLQNYRSISPETSNSNNSSRQASPTRTTTVTPPNGLVSQ